MNVVAFVLLRPYNKRYHSIRQIANVSIELVIVVAYTVYMNLETQVKQKGSAGIIIIFVVMVLLFCVIVYNNVALIYDLKSQDKIAEQFEE